jgi:phosphatidylglycerol:prolipoprotein diacylglycerol transferase
MYPRLGNQDWITPYGLFLLLACLACWWLARREARRSGLDPSHVDLLVPLAIAAGLLAVVLLTESRIRAFPLAFGGMAAVFIYSRVTRQSFGQLLDILAIPTVAALMIQRGGCFLAGCCWGDIAVHDDWLAVIANTTLGAQLQTLPWAAGDWVITAVTFPEGSFAWEQQLEAGLISAEATRSLPVHPTQLYEVILLIPVILLLSRVRRVSGFAGAVALSGFAAYGFARFVLEFLRADSTLLIGELTGPQLTSAIVVGTALFFLANRAAAVTRR